MPKLKTNRSAAKRFKKTKTGKIKRHHSGARHLMKSKTQKQKRNLRKSTLLSDADMDRVARMLPNS